MILADKPVLKGDQKIAIGNADHWGNVWIVPNRRYIQNLNYIIVDLKNLTDNRMIAPCTKWESNDRYMWVSKDVQGYLADPMIQEELKKMYPSE